MPKTTGLESIAKGQSKTFMLDPRDIKVRPKWNFRNFNDAENAAHIESLYKSVKLVGVKEPLTVTYEKGVAWLDDGECRLRAALLVIERDKLDIKVPVKSEERYSNDKERLINQRLRNSGKQFSVFEDATFFKHMIDLFKMQQQEIADVCNISAGRVSQILEYNTVGKVGRDLVAAGKASPSLVMEVTKNEGTGAEKALLEGMKTANANGHTKLKPGDVAGTKVNVGKAVRDLFEYASVVEEDDKNVVWSFPADKFEIIRQILKL